MSLRPYHQGEVREEGGHRESGAQEVKNYRRFLERGSGQSCGMLLRGQDERTDKSLPVSMRWTPRDFSNSYFGGGWGWKQMEVG